MKFFLIAAIILALLMAFFATQNAQQTQVSFMGWYFDGPLVIILLLSFATGAIAALLAMLPGMLSKAIELSKVKTRLLTYEQKLALLENQSLTTGQQQQEASAPPTGANL